MNLSHLKKCFNIVSMESKPKITNAYENIKCVFIFWPQYLLLRSVSSLPWFMCTKVI